MDYKELIPYIISNSLSRFMESTAEEMEDALVPPRRRKGTVINGVGKLFLPADSIKVLGKLSRLYGIKEIELAELILQSVLNMIPIIEMADLNKLSPEQVISILADTMSLDKNIHKAIEVKETINARKLNGTD